MTGPLGGVEAGDPRAPTINAKKRRRRASWEVPELDIQEHPPSMLRNVDSRPLGGTDGDSGGPTINVPNVDGGPPGRCRSWRSRSAHH
jgi:hypothetical protein